MKKLIVILIIINIVLVVALGGAIYNYLKLRDWCYENLGGYYEEFENRLPIDNAK